MNPATSERNLTPSSTAPGSPPSTTAGTGLVGQIVPVTALTATLRVFVALWAPAVTWTVKLEVPAAVGVPEIRPEFGVRLRPAGSDPLTIDHVYGGDPPVAVSVAE